MDRVQPGNLILCQADLFLVFQKMAQKMSRATLVTHHGRGPVGAVSLPVPRPYVGPGREQAEPEHHHHQRNGSCQEFDLHVILPC
jgi:hypothetical protein